MTIVIYILVIYIAARCGDIVSGGKLGFMLPVTFEKVRTNTPSNFSLAKTIWFLKGAIATTILVLLFSHDGIVRSCSIGDLPRVERSRGFCGVGPARDCRLFPRFPV